jgi:DNA-binding response OmpR family regulator
MASGVRVLLVDDNPMIIGMLKQALEPHCLVNVASDSTDALLRSIDDPPDLIISDYQMPGLDGKQLLEKLKSRANTARVPIILMASRTDLNEKLKVVRETVEDFLEKPFYLREAGTHLKHVIDKVALEKMAREAGSGDSSLNGSLAQMNVIDLLQSLELGHKNCALTLTNNGDRCDLFFADGQINHAVYGPLSGDEAVYKVLMWTAGSFKIDFTGRSKEQTCTRSTQGLLMEGLRLLDEQNRDSETEVDPFATR